MATLTTQTIARAGVVPTYAAAAGGGDRFTPDGQSFLHVKNAGGSPITVTIPVPAKVDNDISLSSLAVTVANASEKMIGPFPPQQFTSTDGTGLGDITYSGVTSVTVAVVKLSQP